MKKLLTLGLWNTYPADSWQWCCPEMTEYFKNLTGFKIRFFHIHENYLFKESFLFDDVEKVRQYFDNLSSKDKLDFVEKIIGDFYQRASAMESFIGRLKKRDLTGISNSEIIEALKQWLDILPKTTLQIWFAVFIDQWHQQPGEPVEIKKKLGLARDRSGKVHDRAYKLAHQLYKELSRRLYIPFNEILLITPAEMIGILKEGVNGKKFKDRLDFVVFTNVNDKLEILSGKAGRKFAKNYKFDSEDVKDTGELQGVSASTGSAKGPIKFIFTDKQFGKFKEGEVLEAYQNMVHYVPLMKKSAAIITEFGGLTSHAAVVSRELGKPCVVGIKGLTKLLVDGDLVEVDANKGIVRKLKN